MGPVTAPERFLVTEVMFHPPEDVPVKTKPEPSDIGVSMLGSDDVMTEVAVRGLLCVVLKV